MKNIERRLFRLLIAKGVDKKKISMDSDYYFDLNLDMLDLMSFAGSIKNEFSVNIPENEIYKMEKISDTIYYLKSRNMLYSH